MKRRPLIQRPILVRTRLLQGNTTGVCGDNVRNTGEECDDGNTVSGDGCSAGCVIEYCGDGITNNVDEQCDSGPSSNNSSSSSNSSNSTNGGCTNCKLNCGNGVLDSGEECDDGNTVDGDGCSSQCLTENQPSYKAALGVGLGVSAVALVGVVAGTAAAPAGAGVASSLIGVQPMTAVTTALNQGASMGGGQAGQAAAQQAINHGKHLGQLK